MKNQIIDKLMNLSDDEYKVFNIKSVPTKQVILGVKVPILRQIAQDILKDDPQEFIKLDKQNIYEMIMLEGLVLSYMPISFKNLLPMIESYLNKVDNWAQVDYVISGFKTIKKEKEVVRDILNIWINSKNDFIVRSAIVIVITYYMQEDNLNFIFTLSQNIINKGYYVYMANAWMISVCMAKFPSQTIEFFKYNTLDIKTHNKAIQKSKESYRVSQDNKNLIQKYLKN